MNAVVYINIGLSLYLLMGIWMALKLRREMQSIVSGENLAELRGIEQDLAELKEIRTMLEDEELRAHPRYAEAMDRLETLERRAYALDERKRSLERKNKELADRIVRLDDRYGTAIWNRMFVQEVVFWFPYWCKRTYRLIAKKMNGRRTG